MATDARRPRPIDPFLLAIVVAVEEAALLG
jgi:hypothetical protein